MEWWQGLLALGVSVGTFLIFLLAGMRPTSRDRYGDLITELERCRRESAQKDETIRELSDANERLMRRLGRRFKGD